ncbi:unnamed protein product [Sphagnum jensenii]|uniref:Uncharacterized protein n=1 Tax=Sphagnum jensenii TaxID=128206 RepID=A0ABP1AFW2_9BRYO
MAISFHSQFQSFISTQILNRFEVLAPDACKPSIVGSGHNTFEHTCGHPLLTSCLIDLQRAGATPPMTTSSNAPHAGPVGIPVGDDNANNDLPSLVPTRFFSFSIKWRIPLYSTVSGESPLISGS